MWKKRITALLILLIGIGIAYFVYQSEPQFNPEGKLSQRFPFKLGLDLSGGTHLVYRADTSAVAPGEIKNSMDALRDVIERRINLFGVSEPNVQTQEGGFARGGENRLIVDLPGVTDINQAVTMIGETPLLEFKVENPDFDPSQPQEITIGEDGVIDLSAALPEPFIGTELTGKYLKRATLEFDQTTNEPIVSLTFDKEGSKLFEEITEQNIGKLVAIYLDGAPISTPVVREKISGGQAQISGDFTPEEAKQLVGRLNSGALPIPIELISTQTIGPTLGDKAVQAGVKAGIIGFLILAILFIIWYRLPGVIAVLSLGVYISIMFALFKLIPVVLTTAGIAGFIISLGIAVDANILIFERLKEELKAGRNIVDAIKTGFDRAWLSIRDANISSIISAVILFWFGTSLIKGFALTFGLGVLISMISAIVISRVFLFAVGTTKGSRVMKFLFSSGLSK